MSCPHFLDGRPVHFFITRAGGEQINAAVVERDIDLFFRFFTGAEQGIHAGRDGHAGALETGGPLVDDSFQGRNRFHQGIVLRVGLAFGGADLCVNQAEE